MQICCHLFQKRNSWAFRCWNLLIYIKYVRYIRSVKKIAPHVAELDGAKGIALSKK